MKTMQTAIVRILPSFIIEKRSHPFLWSRSQIVGIRIVLDYKGRTV